MVLKVKNGFSNSKFVLVCGKKICRRVHFSTVIIYTEV